jgi:putative toxin-antitoxin system antitoxin component (TIGR02293 family)
MTEDCDMASAALQDFQAAAPAVEENVVRAYKLLGGQKMLRHPVSNSIDAHDLIERGIPAASLMVLIDGVQALSRGDALEKAIGMSIRTFQRRRNDAASSSLSAEQSSRAWRFAEILAQAIEVLGSKEAAQEWLLSPAIGLDNRRPIDLLTSVAGAEAVGDYLTRMEYGVYT